MIRKSKSTRQLLVDEFTHPANILSLLRLPFAILVIAYFDNVLLASIFFIFGGLTDVLDGPVARRKGPTLYGSVIDGFCDKFFFGSVLIYLVVQSFLSLWQLPLLMIRDITVPILTMIVVSKHKKNKMLKKTVSHWPSKLTTFGQFVAVLWLLAGFNNFLYVLYPVALIGLIAAIDYSLFVKKNL
ncbi:MAG: CDP-alcohol phosphatidyltransferase family protein [Candidatus Woesearchaeota archaeon]